MLFDFFSSSNCLYRAATRSAACNWRSAASSFAFYGQKIDERHCIIGTGIFVLCTSFSNQSFCADPAVHGIVHGKDDSPVIKISHITSLCPSLYAIQRIKSVLDEKPGIGIDVQEN